MAIGDGFGYPTEFLSLDKIKERWGKNGLEAPLGEPIMVTDDTQMAVAVANALQRAITDDLSKESITNALIKEFVTWLNDSRNDRAPGMTCLVATENLEKGLAWNLATVKDSKGCGANMRVVPVGLLTARNISTEQIGRLAQFQAVITHAHPTALTASEITAITIVKLINGTEPENLLNELERHAKEQWRIYHDDLLAEIWNRPPFYTSQDYIAHGWDEVLEVLAKVRKAMEYRDEEIDPCLAVGDGWKAEDAFGTALYCFLLYPNDPAAAMRRAINSRGDSDSIGCLTGAMVGAHCGVEAIPPDWISRIEYQNELNEMVKFFSAS